MASDVDAAIQSLLSNNCHDQGKMLLAPASCKTPGCCGTALLWALSPPAALEVHWVFSFLAQQGSTKPYSGRWKPLWWLCYFCAVLHSVLEITTLKRGIGSAGSPGVLSGDIPAFWAPPWLLGTVLAAGALRVPAHPMGVSAVAALGCSSWLVPYSFHRCWGVREEHHRQTDEVSSTRTCPVPAEVLGTPGHNGIGVGLLGCTGQRRGGSKCLEKGCDAANGISAIPRVPMSLLPSSHKLGALQGMNISSAQQPRW